MEEELGIKINCQNENGINRLVYYTCINCGKEFKKLGINSFSTTCNECKAIDIEEHKLRELKEQNKILLDIIKKLTDSSDPAKNK